MIWVIFIGFALLAVVLRMLLVAAYDRFDAETVAAYEKYRRRMQDIAARRAALKQERIRVQREYEQEVDAWLKRGEIPKWLKTRGVQKRQP